MDAAKGRNGHPSCTVRLDKQKSEAGWDRDKVEWHEMIVDEWRRESEAGWDRGSEVEWRRDDEVGRRRDSEVEWRRSSGAG